jgi:hypothetical protein
MNLGQKLTNGGTHSMECIKESYVRHHNLYSVSLFNNRVTFIMKVMKDHGYTWKVLSLSVFKRTVIPSSDRFSSLLFSPYAISYILSLIVQSSLIIRVLSIYLGDSSILSSYLSSCTCLSSSISALYITYLNLFLNLSLLIHYSGRSIILFHNVTNKYSLCSSFTN